MWLRIVDIDFDAGRIHAEVAPDELDAFFPRLEIFVSRCAGEGLADVRLHYHKGTGDRDLLRLQEFAALKQLTPPCRYRPVLPVDGDDRARFRCELLSHRPIDGQTGPRVRYHIMVEGVEHAVERLNSAIALIGVSEELDARSTLQLRLFVYELVTNTVEHGTFTTDSPAVSLGLSFSSDRVSVTYRDNAETFLTAGHTRIDLVEEQINSSSKRGLGLYMLNLMCSDFDYQRTGNWNITSFSIEIKRKQATVKKR